MTLGALWEDQMGWYDRQMMLLSPQVWPRPTQPHYSFHKEDNSDGKNVQGLLWNFCNLSHIIYYHLIISLMAIPEKSLDNEYEDGVLGR